MAKNLGKYTYSKSPEGKPRAHRRATIGQDVAESVARSVDMLTGSLTTRRSNAVEESVTGGKKRTRHYY